MPTTRTSLHRPKRNLPQKKTFLVLHEPGPMGEYLAWIRRVLEHPHIYLEEISKNESVSEAAGRVDAYRKDAKLKTAEFDEVWLALDLSVHPDVTSLESDSKRLHFAVVSPSFEFWLLSHFEEVGATAKPEEVFDRLQSHLTDYSGSLRNSRTTCLVTTKVHGRAR